eukprot:CAMPEP_0170905010 /NCGR_PEP_ID=MMETSP0734-20130129/50766_1 /TAXON_ID=186038 /ORGANISM="Fragilariopsis kerguelensis, Strain L26-C5" /LENGTH=60 /DNA_ID=CAMNT_0011300623 /DNA_START=64 /DNA_END=242 /DNA_ORIENTATION=+
MKKVHNKTKNKKPVVHPIVPLGLDTTKTGRTSDGCIDNSNRDRDHDRDHDGSNKNGTKDG